ncbi:MULTISPECIES: hypothetical protein [Ralstonia]|jgi:hypothetical protein|uniref:Uncharacterized protein n=1 Tax=Ralstonia pickettii OR214 TaxID=1264675 RepID=R0CT71_RALPI|nr:MULTISPECIES: hypothetical protein [Ralstonia]ENZ79590.1 hypothetical protein OR214_00006 [Ralstonia pickettii OR214]MBL4778432.1 hypothetical protein [Ralstonia sp.]MCM3582125.1 hypothetical protein [Ralstonia pickettii]
MQLTDNQAAERQADRENEFSRRAKNNRILNAVTLGAIVCMAVLYLIPHGGF